MIFLWEEISDSAEKCRFINNCIYFDVTMRLSSARSFQILPRIHPQFKERRNLSSSSNESSPVVTVTTTNFQPTTTTEWEKVKDRIAQAWDEHSGQRELEQLKRSVQLASDKFDSTVASVTSCRIAVEEAHKAHDESQKQLGNLLMRRDQWDGNDAASFVEYTSREVKSRDELTKARNELRKAEENSSRSQREFMDVLRQRYHEEQMWQEKWRMLGTFGTWTLIGLNSIVFLGSQFFHHRREVNRLKAIEELIKNNLQEINDTVASREIATVETTAQTTSNVISSTDDSEEMTEAHNDESETIKTNPEAI